MQAYPRSVGLYDPRNEHEACGIGAVVNISGKASHEILAHAREIIENMQHRGGAGSDDITGDGGGILFQLPHRFFEAWWAREGRQLPAAGAYGVAMVFGPQDTRLAARCWQILEAALSHYGLGFLGWRDVPCEPDCLGDIARKAEPRIRQLFIAAGDVSGDAFERKLYLARRRAEHAIAALGSRYEAFYVCSMSHRTICYKGMFLAPQLFAYYPDLRDPEVESALAVVHQRYSTNTFPSWKLAQPLRMVAHNGEINTLQGNVNKIEAAESFFESPLLAPHLSDVVPVLTPGQSDSAAFDNVCELLTMSGRGLPHAMMMMIPEAFGPHYHISTDKRAFYEYHAAIMAPWDGPAAMVFTDGRLVGGTLDRNGLRPCRYVVTNDGLVVLASEVGVIDIAPERVHIKGRLQPGKMFLVDTGDGRIISDREIKSRISRQKPYRRWLEQNRIELVGRLGDIRERRMSPEVCLEKMKMFGYTREDLHVLLLPMAQNSQEPVGSMGNDVPLAVLSDKRTSVFQYFKQMFAQVTNPPIDPLREGLVMSLMAFGGKSPNLLTESEDHCHQLKLPHPILTNDQVRRLREEPLEDFAVQTVDALFDATSDEPGRALRSGLDRLVADAITAVASGVSLLIISDRNADRSQAPIPSLLATGAVHHVLLRRRLKARADLIIESGEPREVQHLCLLLAYGAFAINPYMAFEGLGWLHQQGHLPSRWKSSQVIDNYINALKKGILKTMSKMGISTLRSYRDSELFECIGLDKEVIDFCFSGTRSRIRGVGFEGLAAEAVARHREAVRDQRPGELALPFGGEYAFREQGAFHAWNPETIPLLQRAVRSNSRSAWEQFAALADRQTRAQHALRGLLKIRSDQAPIPIETVEPAAAITRRFCTGAMSHGSISREAHETLAAAMNALGGMGNTGEGGEDPCRYEPRSDQWDLNSAIKQVASARFGVTIHYLSQARELQIKMAQGAKPGEGGQLPGHKVSDEIATLRYATPGVSLISPPPHHDIYSIEDLAQLIYDLKCSNPGVKVSVKLVAEVGVGTVAAGVAKGNADEVLISGHDGGTGASPLSSVKHAGGPWELGLAETQQTLILNGLRDRIRVQTDGQLKTGRDIVMAGLLGAERFGFGTSALTALGCIMMRKCHLGTCPVGIATQDPQLRRKFKGRPEHVIRFMTFMAEDVRAIMAKLGFKTFDDLVGRVDLLETDTAIQHYKRQNLDLTPILTSPKPAAGQARRQTRTQSDPWQNHIDWKIIERLGDCVDQGRPASLKLPIRNMDRAVGTILSNRIVGRHGAGGLPDDTITLDFEGSAGQSFGAFACNGLTLRLTGDANDYLGKGLSGARIIVRTPAVADLVQHENIIAGNTLLYGATRGEAYINGLVGERFAVRNSGVTAVVEGVGDHGCEYMTGGVVVVLGDTGRNFAAGMSGGIAYVMDEHQLFDTRCNLDMVDLENVWLTADIELLQKLVTRHVNHTDSKRGRYILDNWRHVIGRFVKVIPIDYRRALERMQANDTRETECIPATEEVFH